MLPRRHTKKRRSFRCSPKGSFVSELLGGCALLSRREYAIFGTKLKMFSNAYKKLSKAFPTEDEKPPLKNIVFPAGHPAKTHHVPNPPALPYYPPTHHAPPHHYPSPPHHVPPTHRYPPPPHHVPPTHHFPSLPHHVPPTRQYPPPTHHYPSPHYHAPPRDHYQPPPPHY